MIINKKMIKKITSIFLAVLFLMLLFACASDGLSNGQDSSVASASRTPRDVDFEYFISKTIGLVTGMVFDTIIENDMNGTVAFYSDVSAGLEDVRQGRIPGFILDLSISTVITSKPENSDLTFVLVPGEIFSGPLAAFSVNQQLVDRFNVFLASLQETGELETMVNYWLFDKPGSDPDMPDIPVVESGEVLKVVTSGMSVPFSYIGNNGELKGLCIELMKRFALLEGFTVNVSTADFASLIPEVVSGRADICMDAVTITEERSKSVIFTDPFFYDYGAIITLKYEEGAGAASDDAGFIDWLKTGIERNLIKDARWKLIVDGLGVTMTIAFFAQIFGTIFGAFVCWLLTNKNRFIRWVGDLYCGIIHGTPMVVLLMVSYYIIFGNTRVLNTIIAIFAFTMITGSSVARILKGAIETVDNTEIEAARSIGFSAFKAFLFITLPQAVKRALPAYTNGFVELVKATAIVGFIAIQDLTRAGDIIRSRTYDAFFPLLTVAVIYLTVTTICVQLFKLIVKRWGGHTI